MALSKIKPDLLDPTVGKGIKQVQTNTISSITINSNSYTTIVSVSITVSQGSTVYVTAQGEQNAEGGDPAWMWNKLFRDNTQIGTSTIAVSKLNYNDPFHLSYFDTNLSAGTYTYSWKAYNGSNYALYGEHSSPMIQAVEYAV